MWKNTVERDKPLMRIVRMRFPSSITKATNTHSEYVILLLFHGINGRTNAPQCFVCTYIACFVTSRLNSNFATLANTHIVHCVLYCPVFTKICLKIKQIKGAYEGRTQQSIINWIKSWRLLKRRVSKLYCMTYERPYVPQFKLICSFIVKYWLQWQLVSCVTYFERNTLLFLNHMVFISQFYSFFPTPSMAQQPLVGQGFLNIEASRSHSETPQYEGLLWTSDQPDAETSTLQTHNTHKRKIYMAPAGFEPTIPANEFNKLYTTIEKNYCTPPPVVC
jgi:hypothetical protein